MYKDYYGLSRNAFEISPDPFFFFPTARHNEALASLAYGIQGRKGLVVITGEPGTGKTLLLRCLLDVLERLHIACACVFNPRLSCIEFLQCLLRGLRTSCLTNSKSELLGQLEEFLLARHRTGSTTVLIVDEGQLLSSDLLEELRLLGNLETAQEKLLQILLLGQPELDAKLDSASLWQLQQRIALRCQLQPLTREEMEQYIRRRLEAAGAARADLFPDVALNEVYAYSRGIPRLINLLCENCLICSSTCKLDCVTPEIVRETAADFHLALPPAGAKPAPKAVTRAAMPWVQMERARVRVPTQVIRYEPNLRGVSQKQAG